MTRDEIVSRVIEEVRPYTSVWTPAPALECTILRTLDVIDGEIPGDLVECGVWMGANSYAMLLAQRHAYGEIRRPVWMYDSFEGMSPPVPKDNAAGWWDGAKNLPRHIVNDNACICPLDRVKECIGELGLGDHVKLVPGWLADTLPLNKPERIAFLRIDCDWYEPITACLDYLEPLVPAGGVILFDDYHAWPGCVAAVADYQAKHSISWSLNEIPGPRGVWTLKK